MGLLETEPHGVVSSLPELMAIAKALEDEAAGRYRQLVRRMQSIGQCSRRKNIRPSGG
jgi:hypothetical protein